MGEGLGLRPLTQLSVLNVLRRPLPQGERARFAGAEFSDAVVLNRPTQPYLVVMERRAAIRRDRVGAGQRVDAAAVGVSRIRPQRFRDQHAAAHAAEYFCVNLHLAAAIAERHLFAIDDTERGGILGAYHYRRPLLAAERG